MIEFLLAMFFWLVYFPVGAMLSDETRRTLEGFLEIEGYE